MNKALSSTRDYTIPQFSYNPNMALEFYLEYGFQIEQNIWNSTEQAEINFEADAMPTALDGTFLPIMNCHRESVCFAKAMKHGRVVAIMERLLGGRVSGVQTEYFFGKPGTKGFSMHQDNFFVASHADSFGSAWSPMVDVNPLRGGLIVYPGSHREPLLDVRETGLQSSPSQDVNAHKLECILPEKYSPVSVDVDAGCCVFLHGHSVQSSHPNQSDIYRRVFLATYIRQGAPFRPGNTAKRTETSLYD